MGVFGVYFVSLLSDGCWVVVDVDAEADAAEWVGEYDIPAHTEKMTVTC